MGILMPAILHQKGVDRLGCGGAGDIYAVNDHVALKTKHFHEPVPEDATEYVRFSMANKIEEDLQDLEIERKIMRQLVDRPSPYLVQPIALQYEEGLYMRRYSTLKQRIEQSPPTAATRLQWYCDILKGLVYFHEQGLAHADVHLGNVLCDSQDRALLCDFAHVSPHGGDHPRMPWQGICLYHLPYVGNIFSVSDGTDLFALGCLIFEMEMGQGPGFKYENEKFEFPPCYTGNAELDRVIVDAWHYKHPSTAEMLRQMQTLAPDTSPSAATPQSLPPVEELAAQVAEWRRQRIAEYGHVVEGCFDKAEIKKMAQKIFPEKYDH